ncbi:uncharacterized protein LOC142563815 [Dermacentor variabilis]|uniref:uncharacterized protein LOC142563815 n=1 Tax=Dermacentor variabilis TaxID=34621 RepID=UPI003F5B4998
MLSLILTLALVGTPLVAASVQTPELISCSDAEDVQVSDVTITDAQIGKTMVVNFTLDIKKPLGSDPTLKVTLRRKDGSEIPCIKGLGTCDYNLCDGNSPNEEAIQQLWDNQCPVPVITLRKSVAEPLDADVQKGTGAAPTTITAELEVTNDGETVGCQSFSVDIAAADS